MLFPPKKAGLPISFHIGIHGGVDKPSYGRAVTKTKFSRTDGLPQEKMRGQRGRLLVQPLGYVMSTKVIFRRAEVCLPRRPHAGQPRSDI